LLGQMTLDLVGALADLGANRDVVSVGTSFLTRLPNAPEYEAVALAVADADVRLKDRAAERAVLQTLLDRVAARQPANRPPPHRSTSRWIYRPDPQPTDESEEGIEDTPPDVFIAPNGTPVEASDAGRFAAGDDTATDDTFEPTNVDSSGSGDDSDSDS